MSHGAARAGRGGAAPLSVTVQQTGWDDLVAAIAEIARIPPARVEPNASLIGDLVLDSFGLTEVAVLLSVEYGMEQWLGERDWSGLTVRDLYDAYKRRGDHTVGGQQRQRP